MTLLHVWTIIKDKKAVEAWIKWKTRIEMPKGPSAKGQRSKSVVECCMTIFHSLHSFVSFLASGTSESSWSVCWSISLPTSVISPPFSCEDSFFETSCGQKSSSCCLGCSRSQRRWDFYRISFSSAGETNVWKIVGQQQTIVVADGPRWLHRKAYASETPIPIFPFFCPYTFGVPHALSHTQKNSGTLFLDGFSTAYCPPSPPFRSAGPNTS